MRVLIIYAHSNRQSVCLASLERFTHGVRGRDTILILTIIDESGLLYCTTLTGMGIEGRRDEGRILVK